MITLKIPDNVLYYHINHEENREYCISRVYVRRFMEYKLFFLFICISNIKKIHCYYQNDKQYGFYNNMCS